MFISDLTCIAGHMKTSLITIQYIFLASGIFHASMCCVYHASVWKNKYEVEKEKTECKAELNEEKNNRVWIL